MSVAKMYHRRHPPCLHCNPQSYIRMVQNLIERCLLLRMNRDDCVHALAVHARIQPPVTLAVWKELLEENRSFFEAYFQEVPPRQHNYNAHRRISIFKRSKPWI